MRRRKRLAIVHGSGNVFRDFGSKDADLEQLRAVLAARIIVVLKVKGLGVRAAQRRTRIPAAEFSRIRNAMLTGFTVERLISILNRLGLQVDFQVSVHRPTPRPRTTYI